MRSEDKMQYMIQKTSELISSSKNKEEITTRKIADHAGMNPAMINYYFGSKDDLLKASILSMNGDLDQDNTPNDGSRKAMFDLLIKKCEKLILFSEHGLYKDVRSLTNDIEETSSRLCGMREHYDGIAGGSKISSYAVVSLLFSASVDPKRFMEYSGVDITKKDQLRTLVSDQLDILLDEIL